MKTFFIFSFCFFLIALTTGALDVDRFEKRVREWLDLRRELSLVENEWERQRALLQDELCMLEQQKTQLAESVKADQRRVADLETGLDETQRAKKSLTDALDALHPSLLDAERRLAPWQRFLPAFMSQTLLETFRKLPETGPPETPSRLAERIRTIITLYSQLEQLNCSVHAEKLIIRDPEGAEREMDVIFLGLATGFAVSPDNTRGAMGRVTAEGIIWNWDPRLAEPVRRAWSSYQKERSAEFVSLPMEIEDSVQ